MWAIGSHDIACYWACQASPKPYTTAWAWRTLQIQFKRFCGVCLLGVMFV
ncbi:hypothetical protein Ahy_B09g095332 isoform A [Arachis hypogaea]|uniref:Uncharacterized protein n=1 Tax=Arachis hypogaea TaxID=3818 RepID=A0A444XDX5_ARAHY|nr:hypothetical protein Ahy_B09g095332 isoform A [Arachis hypogaea]